MSLTQDPTAIDAASQALLFESHTTYAFADTHLPADTAERLYELVKYAPTAFNAQPLRLVTVAGDAKERLMPHLFEGNRAKTASAPLTMIVAADTNFHDLLPRVLPHFATARDLFLDDTYRTQVAVAQAWLQFGYLVMGARALGLGVGPMSGLDADGITSDLLAGTSLKAIAAVNLGYPGENAHFPRSPRLEFAEVVTSL
jgi:3-hydroxypropanoate dehydrogenase